MGMLSKKVWGMENKGDIKGNQHTSVRISGYPSSGKYKIFYTTLTNFSTKYLVMCKVYTDVGGIK